MIPYAIMGGTLFSLNASPLDIRILDLEYGRITFRLPLSITFSAEKICSAAFTWLDYEAYEYRSAEMHAGDFRITAAGGPDPFWQLFQLQSDHKAFLAGCAAVSREYLRYIQIRSACDEEESAEILTGLKSTDIFHSSWQAQRAAWIRDLHPDNSYHAVLSQSFHPDHSDHTPASQPFHPELERESFSASGCTEYALMLHSSDDMERFLSMSKDAFLQDYWLRRGLTDHPFSGIPVTHIYIGDSFCPLRLPSFEQMIRIMERCISLNLTPVLFLPLMPEHRADFFSALFKDLNLWCLKSCRQTELVVNDFGMLKMLRDMETDSFLLTAGPLFTRRKKDVRMNYKKGYLQSIRYQSSTSTDTEWYRDYLKERGHIRRFSTESCGYPVHLSYEGDCLHLPLFQMNTASFCTLYAACRYHSRSCQSTVSICPRYCDRTVFLYPKNLKMVGLGNTLYGFDSGILTDSGYLKEQLGQGFRRIVWNL